ncbi:MULTISPECIES: amino acid ABC transporter permease [unclassified Streptomyces]|uniref:amino acid ABC transporter permease n=1 Tax=unclassified Streptomyces TaxID=2593676 RepID=UPI001367EB13|nr:amino acid ABC transporter permease [Streptomyces sp. SHP 1-2]MCW5251430.1 amino acid ABC transporter permease [Streptomyces sp. SHP 1-2]MYU22501.1 ABC transporter permease subunit [Streptomyces sp. SID8352]
MELRWIGFLANGLATTLALIALSSAATIVLAVPIAVGRLSERRIVRGLTRAYVETFRSIPLPVLLAGLYFGLGPHFEKIGVSAFGLAVLGLVLNESAYLAEVYRSLIRSVRIGQWRAAASLGLTRLQALRHVIIPQVTGPAAPQTANGIIYIIKGSALASLITVPELTMYATRLVVETFQPLQVYLLVAVFYLALTVPVAYLTRAVSRHRTGRRYRPRRRPAAGTAPAPDSRPTAPSREKAWTSTST